MLFTPPRAPLERRASPAGRPWLGRCAVFACDMVVVLAVMGLYFLARGRAPVRIEESVSLTTRLIDAERAVHVFQEPAIQAASIRFHVLRELANFTYAYLHFPMMALVGVWLWWRGRDRFIFMRNVMFVSMAIGMVFYYLLPAAPPRLMALNGYDFGFIDTVFGGNTAVTYAQPSLIKNEYAAIPSFHFGWIAMTAAAIWINSGSRVLRGAALGLAALMTWAIVASANHLFIDMALGGAVIAISWLIAGRLTGAARAPVAVPVAVRVERDV